MIWKECRDWLRAVEDCFPRQRARRLEELLRESAGAGGRWEIGLDSADVFAAPSFLYYGPDGAHRAWLARAAKALGLDARALQAPASGAAWLGLTWDFKSGRRAAVRLYGKNSALDDGGLVRLDAQPFSRDLLQDESLAAVFKDFSALCPIRDIVTEWDSGTSRARSAWWLRLAEAVPWPRFCRLNMADPFLKSCSRMSYLLLDRSVASLRFEGGRVCAYFRA